MRLSDKLKGRKTEVNKIQPMYKCHERRSCVSPVTFIIPCLIVYGQAPFYFVQEIIYALDRHRGVKGKICTQGSFDNLGGSKLRDRIISENQFLNQKLWHNSLIRIDNSPVFYPEWHLKVSQRWNIWKMTQITFYHFLNYRQNSDLKLVLSDTTDLYLHLNFFGTYTKTTIFWKTLNMKVSRKKIQKSHRPSPPVYKKLVSKKSSPPVRTQQKWLDDCNTEDTKCVNWNETYQLAFKCTKSTKLIEF